MSEDEKKLYDVLFTNDNNPFYLNYGYFRGGTIGALKQIKSKIRKSTIEPILVEDDVNEGSFFIRVYEKDVDTFLSMVNPKKYKQIKVNKKCMNKIKCLFDDN